MFKLSLELPTRGRTIAYFKMLVTTLSKLSMVSSHLRLDTVFNKILYIKLV